MIWGKTLIVVNLLVGQFAAALRLYNLHLNLSSLQGESVACLVSIFGAEYIYHCANTPHQEGISNAPKEFSNKSPAGFPHMHRRGNILIL